jgi:hypothetical protein
MLSESDGGVHRARLRYSVAPATRVSGGLSKRRVRGRRCIADLGIRTRSWGRERFAHDVCVGRIPRGPVVSRLSAASSDGLPE